MAVQRTLVLFKPDTVQRGLSGRILTRFEEKGLKLIGLKLRQFPRALIEQHYEVHRERPFYAGLVDYMTSGPVVALALEGVDAIEVTRGLMGVTNAREAAPGTIRGDFGSSRSFNLVHGSDSQEAAERELGLFFPEGTVDWDYQSAWVYDPEDELGN
jgi:nucleoside-diphosphate kinase